MIKQYTIEPAYTGNSQLNLYEDGKCVKQFIFSDWEMGAYINWAEACDYERAYDEELYLEKYRLAEQAYQEAIADLAYAIDHRLIKWDWNGAD